MPYSTVQYTGDGVTTLFAIPFEYLSEDHVYMTVDYAPVTFTFAGAGSASADSAPGVGTVVTIYRDSNRVAPLVDFVDGQQLTEADLDLANKQAIYIAQEAFDASNLAEVTGDVEAAAAAAAASASDAAASALAAAASAVAAAISAAASEASAVASAASAAAAAASAALLTGPGGTDKFLRSDGNWEKTLSAGLVISNAGFTDVLDISGSNITTGIKISGASIATGISIVGTSLGDGYYFEGDAALNIIRTRCTAGAADEKVWFQRQAADGGWSLYALDDADGASAGSTALQFDRTAEVVTKTYIGGRVFLQPNSDVFTFSDDASSVLQVVGNIRSVGAFWVTGATTLTGTQLVTGNADFSSGVDVTGALTVDGNATMVGASRRITGDFTNATDATRTLFQSSTANGNTFVGALPLGTARLAGFTAYDNATLTDSSFLHVGIDGTGALAKVTSSKLGAGTSLPLAFFIGSAEVFRIDATDLKLTLGGLDANNLYIKEAKTVSFNSEIDDGNSGTSKTIDFTTGQYHKISMTGNCTFTFTAPPGPCVVHLKMTQSSGSHTMTLPSGKWDASYAAGDKLLSTAASAEDLLVAKWDGAAWKYDLKKAYA
jgi:hypothetical protein